MKDKELYLQYMDDDSWLIKESNWANELQNIRESQFAQGNGYMGIRGVLEELPYQAIPGTYLAGIYDKMGSQVDELVNLPNPINFKFNIEGEKLGLTGADVIHHKKILNMKKALLVRHTLYGDVKKRRYDYQSIRFISLHNKNIGVMQTALTPLDADCVAEVNTGIDTSVHQMRAVSEGERRHFRLNELGQERNAGYLVIETLERKHIIIFWSGFYYKIKGRKIFARDNIFTMNLRRGETAIFTKVFCIKHFPHRENYSPYKKETFRIFDKAFHTDFSTLLKNHIKMWERLWKNADILIDADGDIQQQNLRFNIYHMLSACHYDDGFSSIGARALSGEGYRGHVFWDAEIFLMPFYLLNFPEVAKNMLLCRYRRLDKARELAKREGFKGAKFPWESASTGGEETPSYAKNLNGKVTTVHTHEMEHHITADIAYAVYKYYIVTQDKEFMEDYGYEMIFETARLWASRVHYNKRRDRYEIKNVIGPDEFHEGVDNNAYTNMMARWNLLTACKLFNEITERPTLYKRLKERLDLNKDEIKEWQRIGSKIWINIRKNRIIEQFNGYFKLKKPNLTRTDEYGIYLIPPRLNVEDIERAQLTKQSDVLMLLYLLDDEFDLETKRANFRFYIERTIHKSSLSPSIHSVVASEIGAFKRAYDFFNLSLRTDISNIYRNTQEGIHAAAIGGTWQAVIFGFGGIKINEGYLSINPGMPKSWRKISFSLLWRQNLIKLEIEHYALKIRFSSIQKKPIKMCVFSRLVSLKPERTYIFKKGVPEHEWYHY